MIAGRQIRAARGLLGWDATDLASRAELTRETVSKVENDSVQSHEKTVTRISNVFAKHGVEFTDYQGVRLKPSGVEIFEGPERFNAFYDFPYTHLKENGGEVCLSISDERLLTKYRKNPQIHYEPMQDQRNQGIVTSFRILANKSNFAAQYSYKEYKSQPQASLAPTAFYTFGDCLALISFAHHPAPYVVVLQSAPIAESYRQAFSAAWGQHSSPSSMKQLSHQNSGPKQKHQEPVLLRKTVLIWPRISPRETSFLPLPNEG